MGNESEESRFLQKWLMIQERKQQYHHLKLQTEEFCGVINRYLPKPSEFLSLDTVRSDHQKLLDEKFGIENRLQKAGEKAVKFMIFLFSNTLKKKLETFQKSLDEEERLLRDKIENRKKKESKFAVLKLIDSELKLLLAKQTKVRSVLSIL
jgi:hypothetical protein